MTAKPRPSTTPPIGASSTREMLERVVLQLDLSLPPSCIDLLLGYCNLLQRWNATYNLTAIRDPQQMLTHHIADCLAVVGPLRRERARHASTTVLDVGSGGGLPGAVIAMTAADVAVVCVDAVGKKAAFVRQVAVELGLPNLRAEHARIQSMPPAAAHVVTSRAFATLRDFVVATEPHLAPAGVWMALKGKPSGEELAAAEQVAHVFHVEPLTVPGLAADRCIVWMRRREPAA